MKKTFILLNLNNSNINKLTNITSLPENLPLSPWYLVTLLRKEGRPCPLGKALVRKDSVLIGIMLGDGSIYCSSFTSNARLEMSFGQNYKSFAESIGILFNEYMNNPVKVIEIKGKNKIYQNYRLKTISCIEWTALDFAINVLIIQD